MSLSDVTIEFPSGTNNVYSTVNTNGSQVLRSDLSAGIATPETLELSHQSGSSTRPDRHLVKLNLTKQDSTDMSMIETESVHVVFTLGRKLGTAADAQNLFGKLKTYLNDAKIAEIVAGSLG